MKQGSSITFMPNSVYLVKGEKCNGRKLLKMCLIVLLLVNADRREKIEPLVIRKSKNLHCFKHIKSFNTKYFHNKKSWMTGSFLKITCMILTELWFKKEKFFYSSSSPPHILLLRQI